jgi:hypothetical protein
MALYDIPNLGFADVNDIISIETKPQGMIVEWIGLPSYVVGVLMNAYDLLLMFSTGLNLRRTIVLCEEKMKWLDKDLLYNILQQI